METGVAREPIASLERYRQELRAASTRPPSRMQLIIDRVQAQPKRVVFAEGEEEKSIRPRWPGATAGWARRS